MVGLAFAGSGAAAHHSCRLGSGPHPRARWLRCAARGAAGLAGVPRAGGVARRGVREGRCVQCRRGPFRDADPLAAVLAPEGRHCGGELLGAEATAVDASASPRGGAAFRDRPRPRHAEVRPQVSARGSRVLSPRQLSAEFRADGRLHGGGDSDGPRAPHAPRRCPESHMVGQERRTHGRAHATSKQPPREGHAAVPRLGHGGHQQAQPRAHQGRSGDAGDFRHLRESGRGRDGLEPGGHCEMDRVRGGVPRLERQLVQRGASEDFRRGGLQRQWPARSR
mmetsp:Transcript_111574/g.320520  ORF Transcript_111574/g.320520 Transcript_111574/m.320520 type:complete len:280 (-) Transcript_111574:678-1517(-)